MRTLTHRCIISDKEREFLAAEQQEEEEDAEANEDEEDDPATIKRNVASQCVDSGNTSRMKLDSENSGVSSLLLRGSRLSGE